MGVKRQAAIAALKVCANRIVEAKVVLEFAVVGVAEEDAVLVGDVVADEEDVAMELVPFETGGGPVVGAIARLGSEK